MKKIRKGISVIIIVCLVIAVSTVAWAIRCPKCNAGNKSSNNYCRKCGAALRPELEPPVTTLKGPKKTIGVLSFENKSNWVGQIALGDDFSEMLTDALMNSGRFIVVARQDLSAVITEQDLAATDRFAPSQTARKGKLVPAQIIIKGAITEFESRKSGGGTDIRFGNFGAGDFGISGQTENAHVAAIIYIIDTSTGQILDSKRVEGTARAGGMGFDWGYKDYVSLGTSGFKKTPLGKATQQVIDEAVKYIADKLAAVPWSGRVVKVDGNTVYVNGGSNIGINVNDTFTVYGEGETMLDPVTGMPLGAERTKLAKIIVNEVQEKFCKASIIQSCGVISRGDLVTEE